MATTHADIESHAHEWSKKNDNSRATTASRVAGLVKGKDAKAAHEHAAKANRDAESKARSQGNHPVADHFAGKAAEHEKAAGGAAKVKEWASKGGGGGSDEYNRDEGGRFASK